MTSGQVSPRIVVRAPNWVGDAVMATPFFASLRKTFPDSVIACLCRPLIADIFRYGPHINHIIEFDETFGRSGWRAVRANAARLRRQSFDLAISLPNSLSSALIFFLARIPMRVGYRGDWRRMLLTRSIPFPKKGRRPHRVESYLKLLSLVFAEPIVERTLNITIDPSSVTLADEQLRLNGIKEHERFVCLAPGAAQPNKMWPVERFAELAQRLMKAGRPVVLVGGPNENKLAGHIVTRAVSGPDLGQGFMDSESSGADSVTKVTGTGDNSMINLAGAGPLLFTAEIIRRSAVFVGNDSGLAHVAAAVGTPSVILSGPGDPTEVTPYSPKAITLAKSLFCKPCYKNYCWRKDGPLECLELIDVEEVLSAIKEQMNL